MNGHRLKLAKFLGVTLLLLSLTASASAAYSFFVATPAGTYIPALRVYNQTATDWWKWALAQPADRSPLLDTDGSQCKRGQPLVGPWYLAGTLDESGAVTRSCTVPNFRTLIIPVANVLGAAFLSDPPNQRTESYVRDQARVAKDATGLSLTIDGNPVAINNSFYEESTLFNVTLPANNVYGLDAGTVLSPSADAGYYVAISGLLPGNHTIVWHSVTLGFEQTITYNIRVNLL